MKREFKTISLARRIEKPNVLLDNKLEVFLDLLFDQIYVTDGQGITIFINKACEEFYGVNAKDLIGKHVVELEQQGLFSPSIAMRVIKEKKAVTLVQTTKKQKKLLVTAVPVFDQRNQITMVVTTSRDITELSQLRGKLAEAEKLVQLYITEINQFKVNKMRKEQVIAESPAMKEILKMVNKIALVDSTILIEGESGSGKGVIATKIHALSTRRERAFVTINCGAIPDNLIESELFGYKRGAFTGANKDGKKGLIELASGGTLFLDEISELPHNLQVKLLHVIQEKKIIPVGSCSHINVDIRIIAATNQDINKLVDQGKFRQDLYYRLNVVPVKIPPLRHRREDIEPLLNFFLKKFNDLYLTNKRLLQSAVKLLYYYEWPGNVRELENLIERIVVTTDSEVISTEHLPDHIINQSRAADIIVQNICPLKYATEEMEKQLFAKAYDRYQNTYKIAEILEISQSTAVRKLNKYLKEIRGCKNKSAN